MALEGGAKLLGRPRAELLAALREKGLPPTLPTAPQEDDDSTDQVVMDVNANEEMAHNMQNRANPVPQLAWLILLIQPVNHRVTGSI